MRNNDNKENQVHKKVLIIGDADSIWVKTIIERTHIPFGDQVSVLSFKNSSFTDYYKLNNIKVFTLKSIKSFAGPFNLMHNIGVVMKPYDLIVIHFVQPHRALLANIGRFFSKKLVLVFWGSDILRLSKNKIVEKAIKNSDDMVIGTREMEDRFHEWYGDKYDDKIKRINFGANGIDTLNEKHYDLTALCEQYGIDQNKVVLSIGYSNSFSQQHLKILEAVGTLSKELRDKIHIMLRLSYGDGSAEYINSIKKKVVETGCSSTVFETYLSKEEIAETTSLADIFVHALITDARSASMCEHMFAGSLVMIPSWIKYDIFSSAFVLKYDDFEELGSLLAENIVKKHNSKFREQLDLNRQRIYEICSWDVHVRNWRDLYNA